MANRVFVRKLQDNLWQWRPATNEGQWLGEEFFTGDINLLKESIAGQIVWLLMLGTEVVTQVADADINDRKQLLKTLPFELEEDIIDPVEDLHFAFGPLADGKIPVAYADIDRLREAIGELEAAGAEVQRCLVDYLQMAVANGGWTFLLEGERVWAHTGFGSGFVAEADTAAFYFNALAQSSRPAGIQLVADDDAGLDRLAAMLPPVLINSDDTPVTDTLGCYWDLVDPKAAPVIDFRSGALARKLPLDKWWHTWKTPVIAYAAAFLVALGATFLAKVQIEKERKQTVAQTDEIFRQAVPKGNITNPERQLRTMLGGAGAGPAKPSNAVKLITAVAPAIHAFDDVVLRNLRYSADGSQLQLNIEASNFGTFENLRSKIAEQGYEVEIKSATVYGEVHQAQLRVTEAG